MMHQLRAYAPVVVVLLWVGVRAMGADASSAANGVLALVLVIAVAFHVNEQTHQKRFSRERHP